MESSEYDASQPRDRAFWRAQYDRWQASGLSKAAFCRESGLNVTHFYYFCQVFRRQHSERAGETHSKPPSTATARFVPVAMRPEPPALLQLQVGDVMLACSAAVSGAQLRSWLAAIRATL